MSNTPSLAIPESHQASLKTIPIGPPLIKPHEKLHTTSEQSEQNNGLSIRFPSTLFPNTVGLNTQPNKLGPDQQFLDGNPISPDPNPHSHQLQFTHQYFSLLGFPKNPQIRNPMDPTKKRKIDDNCLTLLPQDPSTNNQFSHLTQDDARKIIESFSKEQLLEILQSALLKHNDVLDSVRSIADRDTAQRKLFIRGLGWETTTEGLKSLFSSFGELEEAVVIMDKGTGKSKGYGFVTFKHVDGALLALKEPSKKIDGRVTVTQLAAAGAAGNTGGTGPVVDVGMRKIFVGNVPFDMPADRLLSHFQVYGDVEEGPLGFDKLTGKSKGFALFVYKTQEGAQAALVEPTKVIDGRQLLCKLAIEGKRGKVGGGEMGDAQGPGGGMPGQYGGPGGYNGNSGGYQGHNPMGHHNSMNAGYFPPGQGGAVPVAGNMGGSHYGGPGPTSYGGMGGASGGASMYGRVPPNSGAGGYTEGGANWPSSAYPNQVHQPTGNSPAPRVPPGGMYGTMPPYY